MTSLVRRPGSVGGMTRWFHRPKAITQLGARTVVQPNPCGLLTVYLDPKGSCSREDFPMRPFLRETIP